MTKSLPNESKEVREKRMARDREWHKTHPTKPEIAAERQRRQYSKNPDRKKSLCRAYNDIYPERVEAKWRAQYAIKMGIIQKNNKCFFCERRGIPIEGHHFDYDKPLELIWLCRRCHVRLHRGLK